MPVHAVRCTDKSGNVMVPVDNFSVAVDRLTTDLTPLLELTSVEVVPSQAVV